MLQLTGERTLPGVWQETYWFQRHVAAYRLVAGRSAGLRVLDSGCGEGYGTRVLAGTAATVTGVDLVPDVVDHARSAYPDLTFLRADVCDLPLPGASVDVVASLQLVERLPDVERYLEETARVLRPGGRLFCATPNRLTFTPDGGPPVNPFHASEFAAGELAAGLSRHFRVTAMLGLHHGPRLHAVERTLRRSLPHHLAATAPGDWPGWLRAVVTRVRPEDFTWRTDGGRGALRPYRLDDSLDLLAIAVKPRD